MGLKSITRLAFSMAFSVSAIASANVLPSFRTTLHGSVPASCAFAWSSLSCASAFLKSLLAPPFFFWT